VYVPLHVKSESSIGYGVVPVAALAERAAELGLAALALTDLENLYAQVEHHAACRDHGVRALTGVELRSGFDGHRRLGERAGRLVLLARDETGYEDLCRIVSHRRGALGAPGIGALGDDPLPLVAAHAAHLFVLTDDAARLDQLARSAAFAREQLGLLLVRPGRTPEEERRAVEVARRHSLRVLADPDVLFVCPEQQALHALVVAIRQRRTVARVRRHRELELAERLLRAPSELAELYADLPEAVAATLAVAEACTLDLGRRATGTPPVLPLPGGESADDALRRTCQRALAATPRPEPPSAETYGGRLARELAVISELHLASYFLVVGEIVELARREGVAVVGRGSAGSSLVVHLLGASPADPLRHDLFFERFLHPGKSEWPDIDLDLPSHRRDEVIDRVYQRFGPDRVATVAACTRFQVRSALREGLRALGAPAEVIHGLARALPPDELLYDVDFLSLTHGEPWRSSVPRRELPPATKDYREAWPLLEALLGRPHHVGAHPGGLVIADRPLWAYTALEVAPKGVVITQYDAESIARLNLVKIDLLGNRALSEIEETLELVGAAPRTEASAMRPIAAGGWASIPWDDPATLALVSRAETVGCFQLESPAMRSLLARLPIRSLDDIIAAVALVRPGPAAGDAKGTFVRRARGEEVTPPIDERLAARLAPTHGVLLYEEDVMALLSVSAGLSLAEADELRSAIVHAGDDAVELARLEASFLGRGGDTGAWEAAARFAAYSFNKAHAVSHGQLAYVSALLKARFPLQLTCALINHHQALYPMRTIVAEMQRRGVRVLPPHVNRSVLSSTVEPDGEAVRLGLSRIGPLPQPAARSLLRSRDERGAFDSLDHLLERVPLPDRAVEALVLCGACDGLAPFGDGEEYPQSHEAALRRRQGELPLNGSPAGSASQRAGARDRQRGDVYRALVRIRNELRFLGLHLRHPMAVLREEATRCDCVTLREAVARRGAVRVAGTAAALRRLPTSRGVIAFLTLDDETGLLEAIADPAALRRVGAHLTTPGPFLVEGAIRDDRGAAHLEIARLSPFHERRRR